VEAARGFVAALSDVLGDTMQIVSVTLADGEPLPEWLSLTESDGVHTLDGFVPVDFEGPLTVRVAVTDRESESVEVVEIDLVTADSGPIQQLSLRSN